MTFDLQPTDEQQALREMLHGFASDVLRPAARECESAGATSDEIAKQAHEMGVTAPVDETYGGDGTLDAVTYCIAAEELSWGDPGIAYQLLGSGLAAILIARAGSDAQRQKLLPSIAADPARSFVAVVEGAISGDLDSLATTIDGDKVVGTKYAVVNAPSAPFGVVVGRDAQGLAAAVVEPDAYEIVKPEDKLGLEAAPTSVVSFDGAGDPFPREALADAILWTKLMTGAVAVGVARASLEYASDYAIHREAFGRPIGAFQGISFKIAEMAIEVDAARLAMWKAAWLLDRGEATTADLAAAVGQSLVAAIRCGDDGVQILGGHGYIRDHPVEKWFRDAVTLSVFDSPDLVGDAIVGRAIFEGAS